MQEDNILGISVTTYDVYTFSSYISPLVFVSFVPIVMPIGIGFFIVLLRYAEKFDQALLWYALCTSLKQFIYGHQLKSNSGVYTLFHRKIPKIVLAILFLGEGIILLCVAVSLVDNRRKQPMSSKLRLLRSDTTWQSAIAKYSTLYRQLFTVRAKL